MTKLLVGVLLSLVLVTAVGAQAPAGPTMAETKAWLEMDAVTFLDTQLAPQAEDRYRVTALTFEACVLSWTEVQRLGDALTTWDVQLPMKDVAVGTVAVARLPSGLRFVQIRTTPAAGPVVRTRDRIVGGGGRSDGRDVTTPSDVTSLFVRDEASGLRVVAAIQRAAVLCGATASAF